ncbi:ribosome-associated translation inhibitor RaiA [candidate division WOR-3 bacterium]|nr:ribosome-associated translation inhibitor RaiA [candidate division WOR-3 bacterium]
MEKNITLKGIETTSAIKDRIEKKIEKLERFFDHIISIDLLLSKNNTIYSAEIISRLRHKTITVKEESYEIMPAFDGAFKKMKREIVEYKKRVQER